MTTTLAPAAQPRPAAAPAPTRPLGELVQLSNARRIGQADAPTQGMVFVAQMDARDVVMKASLQDKADNLYYEYAVGMLCLNRWTQQFPVFPTIYDLFHFRSAASKEQATRARAGDLMRDLVREGVRGPADLLRTPFWAAACARSGRAVLVMENIHPALTLSRYLRDDPLRMGPALLGVLLQLYLPLALLDREFTHYDLHDANVLLQRLGEEEDDWVHLIVHLPPDLRCAGVPAVVSCVVPFVTRLIDFGRCYFRAQVDGRTIDTHTVLDNLVCAAEACQSCGEHRGFGVLRNRSRAFFEIVPQIPNSSHDLRLLNFVRPALDALGVCDALVFDRRDLAGAVPSFDDDVGRQRTFARNSTREVRQRGFPPGRAPPSPRTVLNCADAAAMCALALQQPHIARQLHPAHAGRRLSHSLTLFSDGRPAILQAFTEPAAPAPPPLEP